MEAKAAQQISKADWDLAHEAGLLFATPGTAKQAIAIANFATAIRVEAVQQPAPEAIPNWSEIKMLLAIALRPLLKAQAVCHESDCGSFNQSRGSCPCSQDEDALIAADLLNASNKAERAHRREAFMALRVPMNDNSRCCP